MNEIFVFFCIAVGVLYFPMMIVMMIVAKISERKSRKDLGPRPVHAPRKRVP